jgi:hypothetical protein
VSANNLSSYLSSLIQSLPSTGPFLNADQDRCQLTVFLFHALPSHRLPLASTFGYATKHPTLQHDSPKRDGKRTSTPICRTRGRKVKTRSRPHRIPTPTASARRERNYPPDILPNTFYQHFTYGADRSAVQIWTLEKIERGRRRWRRRWRSQPPNPHLQSHELAPPARRRKRRHCHGRARIHKCS